MDRLAGEPRRNPGGLLQRIRWANVARLMFAVVVAVLLADGLPAVGGGTRAAPDLGLPELVLRPAVPAAAPGVGALLPRPLPLQRTAAPKARVKRGSGAQSVRGRSKRPGPAPRAANSPTGSVPAAAAYVTPPATGASAVGEFGP
jgi:hypothetical protein